MINNNNNMDNITSLFNKTDETKKTSNPMGNTYTPLILKIIECVNLDKSYINNYVNQLTSYKIDEKLQIKAHLYLVQYLKEFSPKSLENFKLDKNDFSRWLDTIVEFKDIDQLIKNIENTQINILPTNNKKRNSCTLTLSEIKLPPFDITIKDANLINNNRMINLDELSTQININNNSKSFNDNSINDKLSEHQKKTDIEFNKYFNTYPNSNQWFNNSTEINEPNKKILQQVYCRLVNELTIQNNLNFKKINDLHHAAYKAMLLFTDISGINIDKAKQKIIRNDPQIQKIYENIGNVKVITQELDNIIAGVNIAPKYIIEEDQKILRTVLENINKNMDNRMALYIFNITCEKFTDFIKQFATQLDCPIATILTHDIHTNSTGCYQWKQFIIDVKHGGINGLKALRYAKEYENLNNGNPPKNMTELNNFELQLFYPNHAKNKILAKFCQYYNSEKQYGLAHDKYLIAEFLTRNGPQKKHGDLFPDFGYKTNIGKDTYVIVKAPQEILSVLGAIPGNCQIVTGAGESGAIALATRIDRAGYVVLKLDSVTAQKLANKTEGIKTTDIDWEKVATGKILAIGESPAYISTTGDPCLESFELDNSFNIIATDIRDKLLTPWAKQLIAKINYQYVTVGAGSGTKILKFKDENKVPQDKNIGDAQCDIYFENINTKYWLSGVPSNDILNNFKNNLQPNHSILSNDAINHGINLDELQKIYNNEQIKKLISPNAIKLYNIGFTFSQVHELTNTNIEQLANYEHIRDSLMFKLYNLKITLEDFNKLSDEKLKIITSDKIYLLIQKNIITFKELNELPEDKFTMITREITLSFNARDLLMQKLMTFDELKNLSIDRLKVITSDKIYLLIQKNIMTFKELNELHEGKFTTITSSSNVYELLIQKLVTFNELNELPEGKFTLITSDKILLLIQKKLITFNELNELSIDQIRIISLGKVYELILEKFMTFNEINTLPQENLEDISENIYDLWQNESIKTFDQLKTLPKNKFEMLTSPTAIMLLQQYTTFEELNEFPEDKLKIIIVPQIMNLIWNDAVTFDQLNQLPNDKLEILFSKTNELAKALIEGTITYTELNTQSIEEIKLSYPDKTEVNK